MWRGIACLMVVVFHATFYAREVVHPIGGLPDKFLWMAGKLFIGVPLFFVISGYLISRNILTAIDATHTLRRMEAELTVEYGVMAGALAGRLAIGIIKRQFLREELRGPGRAHHV